MATTIRIKDSTSKELENLKKKLGLKSLNDVVEFLIKEHRTKRLEKMFGVDNISSFTEEDRIEDRG